MSDALDYLTETQAPTQLLESVKKQSTILKQLEFEMMIAEEKFRQAQQKYLDFATKQLPELYLGAGIASLKLEDGSTIGIKTHTKASIKKGKEQSVLDFLRSHNADNLIKEELVVSQVNYDALKAAGIPFEEKSNVNTNSLKAYVLDEMSQGNLTEQDLPEGLSWYQWQQAEIL